MKKCLRITLLLAMMLLVIFSSSAFAANLDPAAWSSSGLGAPTITTTPEGDLKFTYDIKDYEMWYGVTWKFESTADANETFNFDWSYDWFHAWFGACAKVTAFADGPDGIKEIPIYQYDYIPYNPPVLPATGSSSLTLCNGYKYGFKIWGLNGDSNPYGKGSLIITSTGPVTISVDIDVKPGDTNDINLKGKGVLPIAILTDQDFDAAQVDPTTVNVEGISPVHWAMEDVDEDGDLDMILQFSLPDLASSLAGKNDLALAGATLDDTPILGTDTIRIVPVK